MPRDDDKSLGEKPTLQGGKPAPADERSEGDRSTFGGGEGFSQSGLGGFADLPDHDMEIVDLSSRYKIEESLGKGGMGEVLLATDTRLDRKVAIKRIRGDAGSSKAAVARFLTEAKSIAALSHNNVVQIHDYGRDEQGPFLIMEYVAGGSLLDRCKQGPIELEEAVELACHLCDGLGRAHDAGIIHRDIKPANILLTDDGVPKLTDFGLAKAESRDHTMTMAGAVLGTLDFMPPEQRQDASLVDARSDLWSLAATLYQMVTGESPKVIRLKKVPTQLQDLVDKALEEEKDSRYQNAIELGNALRQLLAAPDPEIGQTADLGDGECPICHALNGANRKFCKGCGESLRVACLSCEAEIPVWEKFCGECGGNQKDLFATKVAEEKRLAELERMERMQEERKIAMALRTAAVLQEPPLTNSIGMKFKLIPSGTFKMGHKQTHTVTLTQPFYLGVYAVTQEQYSQVTGRYPSICKGPLNPVESVSWDDAIEFCLKLSAMPAQRSAGCVYRLPTEAEWEYACRAGTKTRYSFGHSEKHIGKHAWISNNSMFPEPPGSALLPIQKHHHPVGCKAPNPWGLHDMHGNVWEWCQDWYGDYPSGPVTNPNGPSLGSARVRRGGCWDRTAEHCQSAYRLKATPSYRDYYSGFRVCLSPSGQ